MSYSGEGERELKESTTARPLTPNSDSEKIQAALKKGSLNTRPVLPPIKTQTDKSSDEYAFLPL